MISHFHWLRLAAAAAARAVAAAAAKAAAVAGTRIIGPAAGFGPAS